MSSYSNSMDGMDELEVIKLGFLAFLHMKDKNILTDQELLEDILDWFHRTTRDIIEIQVHQVHDSPERIQ